MSKVPVNPDALLERLFQEVERRIGMRERLGARTVPAAVVRQHGNVTTAGTSYAELTRAELGYGHLPYFKALWDSGLRPQFLLTGNLDNDTGGQTTYLGYKLVQFSSGEADIALLASDDARAISNVGTTELWKSSGWTSPTITAPTEDHAGVLLEGRVTGGTGTYIGCALHARWTLR